MKIALIGEAWGADEELYRAPFVGAAGQELNRMLSDAGLSRSECFVSNVFNFRPLHNDIATLCCPRDEAGDYAKWPSLTKGKYLKAEYAPELDRLRKELTSLAPNVCVALGNTASWALTRHTAISKTRGAVTASTLVPGMKVIPTYHPAAVLRQYELRHVTVMDLIKAKAESAFPEIRRPNREIWLEPTLPDLLDFYNRFLVPASAISFDIETAMGQITCIGFAPSIDRAIVVPFVDMRRPGNSYWQTTEEELVALDFVAKALALPQPKIAQNGLYDIQYLWMRYGIPVVNFADDTMLLHHALQPESQKSLDFLGSVYTNEVAWKTLRHKRTIKRED